MPRDLNAAIAPLHSSARRDSATHAFVSMPRPRSYPRREVGGAQRRSRAPTDANVSLRRVARGQLRRGRDSNPSGGVGDNLKRHATLHANALKFSSK